MTIRMVSFVWMIAFLTRMVTHVPSMVMQLNNNVWQQTGKAFLLEKLAVLAEAGNQKSPGPPPAQKKLPIELRDVIGSTVFALSPNYVFHH
mmetsp:Transcript_18560/g.27530  ORF Transcript_18560/g.27530 Transcript_18560/m.27530 type:complete len:91 (-) Transcript_18560:99-371(-)